MPSQTEDFFRQYAQTLDKHETSALANHHLLPCVFVLDDQKTIVHEQSEIELLNQRFIDALRNEGVVRHVPQVNQAIRLSDKILFSNVRWQFKDAQDNTLLSTQCSYTLQQVGETELKIIVEVIDDENNLLISSMLEE